MDKNVIFSLIKEMVIWSKSKMDLLYDSEGILINKQTFPRGKNKVQGEDVVPEPPKKVAKQSEQQSWYWLSGPPPLSQCCEGPPTVLVPWS